MEEAGDMMIAVEAGEGDMTDVIKHQTGKNTPDRSNICDLTRKMVSTLLLSLFDEYKYLV